MDNKAIETIPVVRDSLFDRRVAAHSHIKGLGLADSGIAEDAGGGFVGQKDARESSGILVDLIKAKKMAGRAILFVGGSGTGKTALALGVAHELGPRVPFTPMVGSEVYSSEIKKTEVLMTNFRRSIGLRIRETKDVYEGEVIQLLPVETEDALGGYGKTISHVLIGLKSVKGTKTLKLDPSIYEQIQKERISVGDIVYIESNSGAIKRVGRSDAFANEFDLEAERYHPLPKGDVYKRKEVVQNINLHDLDLANAQPQGGQDVLSLVGQFSKSRKTEITEKLRTEINKVVNTYIDQGIAELVPGVLFIDEVHMLDLECFTYLAKALESPLSPVVILATNRGMCTVRGSDNMVSAHGIPSDLLDRLLIVQTQPYEIEQIKTIIAIRSKTEGVGISDEALDHLSIVARDHSLRYALQLLSPARICSQVNGNAAVEIQDIDHARDLFLDAKTSGQLFSNGE